MGDYRERIAAVQHKIWSHWMRYMFSVCTSDNSGNVIIPVNKVQRWQRQINTDYANLTDKERESDRNQADKILAERDAEIAALREQVETMIQAQAYAENTILRQRWMMDAQKRTASDAIAERDASIARMERQLSDNLAKAEMLRAQVAELEAWEAAVERKIQKFSDLAEDWQAEAQENSEDFEKFGRFHRIAGVYEYCVKELQEAIHE